MYYLDEDIIFSYKYQEPSKLFNYTVILSMDNIDDKIYLGYAYSKPDGTIEIYLNDILRSLYPGFPIIEQYSDICNPNYQPSTYMEGQFKVLVNGLDPDHTDSYPNTEFNDIIFQNRVNYYIPKVNSSTVNGIYPTNLSNNIYYFKNENSFKNNYVINFQSFGEISSTKYLYVGCGTDKTPPTLEYSDKIILNEDSKRLYTFYGENIPDKDNLYIWYSISPFDEFPSYNLWFRYKKLIPFEEICNEWFLYYRQRNGGYELLPVLGNVIFSEAVNKSTLTNYLEREIVYSIKSDIQVKISVGYLNNTDVLDGLFTGTDITLFNINQIAPGNLYEYDGRRIIHKLINQDSSLINYNKFNNKSLSNPTLNFKINKSKIFK